jgi:hypothetical protein
MMKKSNGGTYNISTKHSNEYLALLDAIIQLPEANTPDPLKAVAEFLGDGIKQMYTGGILYKKCNTDDGAYTSLSNQEIFNMILEKLSVHYRVTIDYNIKNKSGVVPVVITVATNTAYAQYSDKDETYTGAGNDKYLVIIDLVNHIYTKGKTHHEQI